MAKPYVKLNRTYQLNDGHSSTGCVWRFFLPVAKTTSKKQTNKQTLTNDNGWMQSHTNLKRNTKFPHNDNFNFSLGLYHYIKFDLNCNPVHSLYFEAEIILVLSRSAESTHLVYPIYLDICRRLRIKQKWKLEKKKNKNKQQLSRGHRRPFQHFLIDSLC